MAVKAFSTALKKVFGTRNERLVKRYLRIVDQVSAREGDVRGLSDAELRAQTDKLPEGTTMVEENGKNCHQFDMVFFEEVPDESGGVFYEVVGSPDGEQPVEVVD